jgi:phosphoenolpyruvate carboxykinase (GTP)
MRPFLGYHGGDYFQHWLDIGARTEPAKLPRIFYVNWFRKDDEGHYLWPGFGENSRVLEWALGRLDGSTAAVPTAIGNVPAPGSLNTDGLELSEEDIAAALRVDAAEWRAELPLIGEWLDTFGDRLPAVLRAELAALGERIDV